MRRLTLQQIAEWTDGALIQGVPSHTVVRVATDSRAVHAGELFVALKGENHDAHRFLAEVVDSGASAILVSDLPHATESYHGGIVRVKDTLVALQRLAYHHRKLSKDLFVVGVTGSNGKTTTKDFLASVLNCGDQVNATKGNFNNHVGLPLTILDGCEGDRYGVWEMGMNHPGEIGALTDIALPDAAVITMIGTAHIEYMKTREAIAVEKASLAQAVPAAGYCAMPASDDFYEFVRERVVCEMIPVGINAGVVRAERLAQGADGRSHFDLVSDFAPSIPVALPVRGEHMVMNSLLAAAIGLRRGISSESVAEALSATQLSGGRLEEKTVRGMTVLDDSYNANPDSMQAALRALQCASVAGRRIAVLGYMGELGEHEEAEHIKLGERMKEYGVDILVTVGDRAARIREGARDLAENRNFPTHAEAAAYLLDSIEEGDCILVKGSRSARMERIVSALS